MRMLTKAALVAAVTCSALTAGQALAWESGRAPTAVELPIAGVDFKDKAAVQEFYKRLERAAWTACDSKISDPALHGDDVQCVKAAVRQAVTTLDRPLVTAMYRSKTPLAYARGY